jgi:hypothetical protein
MTGGQRARRENRAISFFASMSAASPGRSRQRVRDCAYSGGMPTSGVVVEQ